ncbi:MAG TPA: CPXCG motif-containing cysteine-rich protein [Gemmatimonadaceae bacterium]|nr:CPXCG motif-containing cysteine-rich protein [Gemmatimonadaceae bacterium]
MIRPPDPLDDDFPLGDGDADLEASVVCPYCAQPAQIALDPGSGNDQSYVEDCPVCCQPWEVRVHYTASGAARVEVDRA